MQIELAPTNPYGLNLKTPVMVAAGCAGWGLDAAQQAMLADVGALVTPTVRLHSPRPAPPQIHETPAGMVYVGNWPTRSLRFVVRECVPVWAAWQRPVVLSLAAHDRDAAAIAGQLEGIEGIAGIEVDCSQVPERISVALKAIRAATFVPILAKLPADQAGLAHNIEAATQAGADALVVAAPQLVLSQGQEGRLCGPAWHPAALYLVAQAVRMSSLPVVAGGGILGLAQASAMLAVGARAVQIGSAMLAQPMCASQIAQQLMVMQS